METPDGFSVWKVDGDEHGVAGRACNRQQSASTNQETQTHPFGLTGRRVPISARGGMLLPTVGDRLGAHIPKAAAAEKVQLLEDLFVLELVITSALCAFSEAERRAWAMQSSLRDEDAEHYVSAWRRAKGAAWKKINALAEELRIACRDDRCQWADRLERLARLAGGRAQAQRPERKIAEPTAPFSGPGGCQDMVAALPARRRWRDAAPGQDHEKHFVEFEKRTVSANAAAVQEPGVCPNHLLAATAANLVRPDAGVRHDEGSARDARSWLDSPDMRSFQAAVLEAMDAKQAALARELHDSVGSSLAGMSMLLEMASKTAADATARRLLSMAHAQATGCIDQVRRISRGILPASLGPGDLVHALESLAADLNASPGITCVFASRGTFVRTPGPVGVHLVRIAQEAVHNALRHGQASRLRIFLAQAGPHNRLTIDDNGIGFAPQPAIASQAGLGLRSMQARAEAFGGAWSLERLQPHGCRIRVAWRATPNP